MELSPLLFRLRLSQARKKEKEGRMKRMAQWAKEIKIETGKESKRANGASGKIGKIVTSKRFDTFLSFFFLLAAYIFLAEKRGNLMSRLEVLLPLCVCFPFSFCCIVVCVTQRGRYTR